VNPTWRRILGSAAIIAVALLWIASDGLTRIDSERDALVVITELLVLAVIGFRAFATAPKRRRRPAQRDAIRALGQRIGESLAIAIALRLAVFFLIQAITERYVVDFDTPQALRPLLVFAIVVYLFWPEFEVRLARWRTPL
jgi:hypothetical protein